METAASISTDSERAEVQAVLLALARTPRLASLLSFVTDKFFAGRTNEITEYNIATEVFGRSKAAFDSTQDSIARVEAYRLRKRLKEYYQTEGVGHEIQISLPPGGYVPAFVRTASSRLVPNAPEPELILAENKLEILSSSLAPDPEKNRNSVRTNIVEPSRPELRVQRKRALLYGFTAIAGLLLLAFGAIRLFSRHQQPIHQAAAGNPQSLSLRQASPANAAQVPLRLLAGYQGSPRIDSAGAYWQADHYFSGGAAFARPDGTVTRTSDPMLFDHWRTGDFSYDIPLAPGPYELHLFFVATPPADFKTQFFAVIVNGQPLLRSFNISADVLGTNIADERVFKDIYPDKDGLLHLKFALVRATPTLNAIEILRGLPHRQLPVRIVAQGNAVTDHSGNLWHPDNYFAGGESSDPPRQVGGTPDPNLYAQERYGHFSYSIPVDTRGRYTLILHFAELYWVPAALGSVDAGSRIFNVYCNGSTLLDNFDISKEAGSLKALTKTFRHLRPSAEGKLDLTFEPVVNYATVSAIEVIDESE